MVTQPAPSPSSLDTRPPMSPDTSTLDTYTLDQAHELLGVSTKTLRRWIKARKISATKHRGVKGPEWRLHKGEMDHLVEQREAINVSSEIVRARVDTQIESMSSKMSSLMQEWLDRWADTMGEIVQGVQAGQGAQAEALQEVAGVVERVGEQQERIIQEIVDAEAAKQGLADARGRIAELEQELETERRRTWWQKLTGKQGGGADGQNHS